jgi:hypothetical protein
MPVGCPPEWNVGGWVRWRAGESGDLLPALLHLYTNLGEGAGPLIFKRSRVKWSNPRD